MRACKGILGCDETSAVKAVLHREEEDSTFLNEGLAIPHVCLKGLTGPGTALGVTRGRISGEDTEESTGYVFLSITPDEKPESQIEILTAASRAFQDCLFVQALNAAGTPDDVREAIAVWAKSGLRPL